NAERLLFFFSASAFGPYLLRRSWTSAGLKPVLGSTANLVSVSPTVALVGPVTFGVGMNNSPAHLEGKTTDNLSHYPKTRKKINGERCAQIASVSKRENRRFACSRFQRNSENFLSHA